MEYVDWLQEKRGAERLHTDIIYIKDVMDDIMVEAAFQYNTDFNNEAFRSFANNIHTVDGGTHELAFKRALNKVVNDFVKKYKERKTKRKRSPKAKRRG